jgi:SAM-dependent methyltransferase
MKKKLYVASLYKRILFTNFKHFSITSSANVLDVGCGNGDVVNQLLIDGFNAFGIDVNIKDGVNRTKLESNGRLKHIDIGSQTRETLKENNMYTWPNFEIKFDVIISKAVLEHVRNLEEFIAMSKNALSSKDGVCIHYYPSKYSLIEPHTGVPLGGIFQNRTWYAIMYRLGFYSRVRKTTNEALEYMKIFTFFRSQKEIDNEFKKQGFQKLKCIQVLSCHPNKILRLIGLIPFANNLFGIFRSRVVAYKKS